MVQHELASRILFPYHLDVSFKAEFITLFEQVNPAKVAVLATFEYEGIFKNGGIGTHYKTLSEQLAADGWYVILLLCRASEAFGGTSSLPAVHHIFSTHEATQVLDLQPVHHAMNEWLAHDYIDAQSFHCFLLIQAIAQSFNKAQIYVEFHEMSGIGYHTIQAKRCRVLSDNCVISVTMHSGHEWMYEANEWFSELYSNEFQKISTYEQYTFEQADVAFFPAHALKTKVESYGWKTAHAQHLPNFIPLVPAKTEPLGSKSSSTIQESTRIPIVFFGRLEMRKGICTFVEAIKSLDAQTRSQIEVHFVGKIVELHPVKFRGLISDRYIHQELQDVVPYRIHPDLYSHEALQLVVNANHPIVCLASQQENFPNTGMEMGQIPVSLVISKTGGFQETLGIVERTSGVYWFESGNSKSLAEMLSKAISRHPEVPSVAKKQELITTNQNLLTQRQKLISQAFKASTQTLEHSNPKVTIGVTCYNLGAYLIECLTSIESQTYRNLEVFVFDDASPDLDTQDHIIHAQSLFPNYKFIRAERNLGLGAARNRLIEMATGEYFLPLDADNRLIPFGVEKFVEAAIASQAAVIICPMLSFGIYNGVHNFRLSALPDLLHTNFIGDACSLFSMDLLRRFKHPERHDCSTQDWCIITSAIAINANVVHYPYPLYEYRQRANSMIKNASLSKERYHLRQYLAEIPPAEWSPRQLYMLMTNLQQLNSQLETSRSETTTLRTELKELRQNLRRVKNSRIAIQDELQQAKDRIQAMATSKFWTMRKGWFKLKKLLRLPNPE